jgi:hypothetical protein
LAPTLVSIPAAVVTVEALAPVRDSFTPGDRANRHTGLLASGSVFFFGDPADIAQNYITEAMSEPGPEIYEAELEGMTIEQLTYATIYDEMFCHLVARDPEISKAFFRGGHKLLEHSPENIDKYTRLVELYAPSAN